MKSILLVSLLSHLFIIQDYFIACNAYDDKVFIGGLLDSNDFDWVEEIFDFVLDLINDKGNGWHDDIFPNGNTLVEGKVVNSECDESVALDKYWNSLRSNNTIIHGLVGCRCSGASSMIARISKLENIPQVSPSASSAKLSDKKVFPYFSRLVPPDNYLGQVGAMVTLLRSFGWNRVTVLNTDTKYSKDFANEFQRLWLIREENEESGEVWEGQIYYSKTILLDENNLVDKKSLHQVLEGVPTEDPRINSRIVLLLAHEHHAYEILKEANAMNFQPDTIWVASDGWANRDPPDTAWIPPYPGYLGIAPFFNKNEQYDDFLSRLQTRQIANGRKEWESLPDYTVGTIVDSILSLAKALSAVNYTDRTKGDIVSSKLRTLEFSGVSGEVSFTEEGDRGDPLISVYNFQEEGGELKWKNIATVDVNNNSISYSEFGICFPDVGCVNEFPSDKYPVPPIPIQVWVLVVLPIIIILWFIFAYRYFRTKQKKKALKQSITSIQQKMKIDVQLDDLNAEIDAAKVKKEMLIKERFQLQKKPETWTASDEILIEVMPKDSQYWDVFEKLRQDMPDVYISKLWRVQNSSLWTYYSFHKDRFSSMKVKENERSVWHGTSDLDPAIIYNDKQDGFMMQFSQAGFWGRGIYFADKASYSHSYTYKPPTSGGSRTNLGAIEERPGAQKDEREMFLTKLLIGSEVSINRDESVQKSFECRNLTAPPANPATNLKYNTVTGMTGGSKVWVVYENGRAYPDYLVRYYRSPKRDIKRTPFESRNESHVSALANSVDITYHWEYQGDLDWQRFAVDAEGKLEHAYQDGSDQIIIQTAQWKYEVDFKAMIQTNLEHQSRRQRDVRRIEKTKVQSKLSKISSFVKYRERRESLNSSVKNDG